MRGQGPLTLRFRTIAYPDGWHPALRLKGDWLVVELSDGVLSRYGEASHSNDDERCKREVADLFARHYAGFVPSLENVGRKEREIASLNPDLVTATAFSALNQAVYDLLARREQVPVWRPKHVGGFGPLLDVMKARAGTIEVSPHNPAGPISTGASLHAAAIYPDVVRTLEYAFDRKRTRRRSGERIDNGMLLLNDQPGWGVEPPVSIAARLLLQAIDEGVATSRARPRQLPALPSPFFR